MLSAARRVAPLALSAAPRGLALAGTVAGLSTLSAQAMSTATCEPAPVIPLVGVPGTKRERTLILLKPDAVERGMVATVMAKFEAKGYTLVGLKMLTPSQAQAEANYDGLKGKPFFPALCAYFTSGPIVCMAWEGTNVIKDGRAMVNEVRAAYAADKVKNCIDGSDTVEGAAEELGRWFAMTEMSNYSKTVDAKLEAPKGSKLMRRQSGSMAIFTMGGDPLGASEGGSAM
jgi:nucleoside-diphosphate kinase